MENEKKGKKVLEIILIILFSLSLVLIPLLNQYRQKNISFNNTQLVKRQNSRNGIIDTTTFDFHDILTVHSGFYDIIDRNFYFTQNDIDTQHFLVLDDFLGLGFTNYFRFFLTDYNILNRQNCYALQYYLLLDTTHSLTFNLCYYEIFEDNDSTGNFMKYSLISRTEFDRSNLIPEFNVLNFSYYNPNNYDTFTTELDINGFRDLFYFGSDFQFDTKFLQYSNWRNSHIVIFENDSITALLNTTSSTSYQEGYRVGYSTGMGDASQGSVFGVLQKAASAISSFMNIEVLPNISMWLLISIPLSISIMIIILRLLRGGS